MATLPLMLRWAALGPLLTLASPAWAVPDIDGMVISADVLGGPTTDLPATARDTTSLSARSLSPVVDEVGLAYGIGISELSSELVLRLGREWASGALPAGSRIVNGAGQRYALSAWPITFGWRMTFLAWRVRPLLGASVGATFQSARYETDDGPVDSGGQRGFTARALVGVHADLTSWLGARLFVEGRLQPAVTFAGAPAIDDHRALLGLAVTAHFARPEPGALAAPDRGAGDRDALLPGHGGGETRLERAFAIIRDADEARRAGDHVRAEGLYRDGVRALPRDPETRRNVEVPVRLDWARTLVHVGRGPEAIEVLEQALAIAPGHEAANQLLDELLSRFPRREVRPLE